MTDRKTTSDPSKPRTKADRINEKNPAMNTFYKNNAPGNLGTLVVRLTTNAKEKCAAILSQDTENDTDCIETRLGAAQAQDRPAVVSKTEKRSRDDKSLLNLNVPIHGGASSITFLCVPQEGPARPEDRQVSALRGDMKQPPRPCGTATLLAITAFKSGSQRRIPGDIEVNISWNHGRSTIAYATLASLPDHREIRDRGDKLIGKWGDYLRILEEVAKKRKWELKYKSFRVTDHEKNQFRIVASLPNQAWDCIDTLQAQIIVSSETGKNDSIRPETVDQDRNNSEIVFKARRRDELNQIPKSGSLILEDTGTKAEVERQRRSIDRLVQGQIGIPSLKDILFSESAENTLPHFTFEPSLDRDNWLESQINGEQRRAVLVAMGTPDFALIQGPPGTGKTTVISELCYQLAREGKRVLVASQTNLAVDNALSKLGVAPEVLAMRLSSKHATLEDDAKEFVGENAIYRWIRGHIAPSRSRSEYLRIRLEIEELIHKATSGSGQDWMNRPFSNSEFERAEQSAAALIAGNARLKGIDASTLAFFDIIVNWNEHCSRYEFDDDSMPGDIWDAAQAVSHEINVDEEIEKASQLLQGIETIEQKRLDLESEHAKLLALESTIAAITGLIEELDSNRLGLDGALRMSEFLPENCAASALYRSALSASCETIRFIGASAKIVDPITGDDEITDASVLRSECKSVIIWTRAARTPLIGVLFRPLAAKSVSKLRQHLINGGRLAEALRGGAKLELRKEDAARSKNLIAKIENEIQLLISKYGDLPKSQAQADIDYWHEFRMKLEQGRRAAALLQSWHRFISHRATAIQARASIARLVHKSKGGESIKERLDSEGIVPPKGPDDEREIVQIIDVLESWARSCERCDSLSPSIIRRFNQNVNVVGSTCSFSASSDFRKKFKKFDYVIIDEVSKATPTELLMPSVLGDRLILVGDHKQLPPMIREDQTFEDEARSLEIDAKELLHGLDSSVFRTRFEELEKIHDDRTVMLRRQYRMHPHIMEGVNQFYNGELRNGTPDLETQRSHHLGSNYLIRSEDTHVVWVDIPQKEPFLHEQRGGSRRNREQAKIGVRILKSFLSRMEADFADRIGLITPYRSQASLYSSLVAQIPSAARVRICSIDRFQGMERDIVILDLTHNHPRIGPSSFLRQHERINVATSRARALLLIIGSYRSFVGGDVNNESPYSTFYSIARRTGGLRSWKEVYEDS